MAGNTINVQGSYIDIHDNEVVNLNIDKATVTMSEASPQAHLLKEKGVGDAASVLTGNADFMAIMRKAVDVGFCVDESGRFRWGVKVEAAYFASVASHRLELSKKHDKDGDLMISWKPFEALFGLKDLRLSYNDYQKCATKVRRKSEIDALFR